MKKLTSILILLVVAFSVSFSSVSAHVVVKPASVGIGSWQTFTMGVPVEKDLATTQMRLVIPEGLEYVTPNVKPGWTIEIKKTGEGENAKVSEVIWSGGSIPAGQRDDFFFSAKVPSTAGEIHWKAYQTYKDGSVVAWEMEPKASGHDDDFSTGGPYSVTQVVDDLSAKKETTEPTTLPTDRRARALATGALAIGVVSLVLTLQKKSA